MIFKGKKPPLFIEKKRLFTNFLTKFKLSFFGYYARIKATPRDTDQRVIRIKLIPEICCARSGSVCKLATTKINPANIASQLRGIKDKAPFTSVPR